MDQKLPLFYRFMALPGSQTKLQLPPFISRKLVEQEVEQVLLTSQKGIWEVQIHRFEGELWLTKGWDDFVLRHGLHKEDLLLFEHTGDSSFKVRVLGITCCERDFHAEPKTKNKRGRTQGKNAEDISEVSVKLEVDIDEVPSPVNIQKHDHTHDEEDTKRGRTQGKNTEETSEVSVKPEVHIDEVPSPVKIQKHDHAHGKEDTERERKRKVVNVSSMGHPQFVSSIKQYNIRRKSPYMHIPAGFCIANGLYHNARIFLKGPSSEQEVSLKVCRGGRTIYAVITRGWTEFIAGNALKVGDICTFKLRSTGSTSNAVVFDVEVLRKST